jgi:hypothetical protein
MNKLMKQKEFSNQAKIEVELDCGNTPMQKDEAMWFKHSIQDFAKELGMKIKKVKVEK